MRKFMLFFTAVAITCLANAQYVNIPDVNFRNFLYNKYPTCFNAAREMDTTCSAILTESTLTVIGPSNLEGLQYFKGLTSLSCSSMSPDSGSIPALPAGLQTLEITEFYHLAALPALPAGLKSLTCRIVPLTALPALPPLLKTISISQTKLSVLPALPDSLEYLYCSFNLLVTIPPLPAGIKYLYCGDNPLTSLPDFPEGMIEIDYGTSYVFANSLLPVLHPLPASLKKFNCSKHSITLLPQLPEGLESLICTGNLLTSLPTLPPNLKTLICNYNPITQLPALPDSLTVLNCMNDSLTSLPALPLHLDNLNCSYNQLSGLPELPGTIRRLDCSYNNIYCLPKLPVPINVFPPSENPNYHIIQLDGDKINCLPNNPGYIVFTVVNGTPVYFSTLCNPTNNVNHCQTFPVISGNAFFDNNNNGIRDSNEYYKANLQLELSNGHSTFTNNNGYFEIGTDTIGSFTITPTAPVYFDIIPSSASYNFTSYDTIVAQDYALRANTIKDSAVIILTPFNSFARPGAPFTYSVSYENAGTTTLSPSIVINFDNTRLTYTSSSDTAVVNNGSTLSLNVGSFSPGQRENFNVYFNVKSTAAIGDSLLTKAALTAGNDIYADSSKVYIRASRDPNDKTATAELSPLEVLAGKHIDYIIRFQNTGTDTAFNIVISDTLSNLLQYATFEMLNASHTCKTTLKNGIVYFEFLNILLPDSNVNELKSHGFVSFRIKPQMNVAANTIIPNNAAIYFDYNAPVITNTAGTLIKGYIVVPLQLVSFSALPQTDNSITLYWNTANETSTKHFVIEQSSDGIHFNALNTVDAKGRANNNYSINVMDANSSIVYYRLRIVDNDGNFSFSPAIKIDRRKNSSGIAVLTNPVKDFIIINNNESSLNNTQCSIINSQGAAVKSFIVTQGSQAVEIKDLPTGVYYLKTISGSYRILIQH